MARIASIRIQIKTLFLTAAVHAVTASFPGVVRTSTDSSGTFDERVKALVSQPAEEPNPAGLDFIAVAEYVVSEMAKINELDSEAQAALRMRIVSLSDEKNPVRKLLCGFLTKAKQRIS